jgi:hypothetical protein
MIERKALAVVESADRELSSREVATLVFELKAEVDEAWVARCGSWPELAGLSASAGTRNALSIGSAATWIALRRPTPGSERTRRRGR